MTIKHKKKPSKVGPWKQFRDKNIYVNPLGEVKYKCGKSEFAFRKWEFTCDGRMARPQMVIITKHRRYFVKRLVWEAFNGPVPKGYAVIHKNGMNLCDELNNLGLEEISKYCKRVCGNHKRRYVIDKTHNKRYKGTSEAAKYLHLCRSSVERYCNGKIQNPMYDLSWGGLVSGEDL